jgi:hypothetical protein
LDGLVVILNIKWRVVFASLNAMRRSPRRFCRHDVLIRFPVRQSFLSAWRPQPKTPVHFVGDDRSSTVWLIRPATPTGEQQRRDNSQILLPDNFQDDSHAPRRLPANV